MKLATLKDDARDGKLVVVSRDLTRCVAVADIAPTMQAVLDDWAAKSDALRVVSDRPTPMATWARRSMKPAPIRHCRAWWADGSAYINHVELVRKARGAKVQPLRRSADVSGRFGQFLARAIRSFSPRSWGIDMEGEVAVITDNVPMGASVERASSAIRLVMLVNDVSLRGLIPNELAKGFGFFQSKPSSAFSPVAVTPEELGDAWRENKAHLPLCVDYNGEPFGRANAGVDMTFDFAQLVAHAAKTRPLGAGSIVGSGTVSNKLDGGPGKPMNQGGVGYSCIAEIRMIETIENGKPTTSFMKFGDTVRIEMRDERQQHFRRH